MKDLIDAMSSIRRAVGEGKLPAGDAHVVTASRTYAAPIDDVWDALTNPERIPRWFLPIQGEMRVGGTYQFEGNAGGEIRECEPPRRLLVTWVMGEPGPEDSSIVEVLLGPTGEGETALKLEHTAVVPEEMWEQYGPGAVGVGWDLGLLGLGVHLAGEEVGNPEDLDKDPGIHAAMTASSHAWGVALAATGLDAESVSARVAATTAFYVPTADGDG
ncbi:MAG TPA: SRPBCC family protein [Acidimicrobiia bacterium]|nr:SRPBCC family protein [Acidimicrobiia bacterium]